MKDSSIMNITKMPGEAKSGIMFSLLIILFGLVSGLDIVFSIFLMILLIIPYLVVVIFVENSVKDKGKLHRSAFLCSLYTLLLIFLFLFHETELLGGVVLPIIFGFLSFFSRFVGERL